MSVCEAKHRIGDIGQLARMLGWPLTGQNPDFAFWRDNRDTPALSIFANGQLWKDFKTGEGGDMVALLARVEGITPGKACARLIKIAESVGDVVLPPTWQPGKTREEKRAGWPRVFATLDFEEAQGLAHRRNFPHFAGVDAATARGLLVRVNGYDGEPWPVPAWGLTDASREAVQIRRLDGKPWKFGKSKSFPGSLGGWPIGIAEVGDRKEIILTEGEPDLLAALTLHCLLSPDPATGRPRDPGTFGFCCMAGGAKKIADSALQLFNGKAVRIVPHVDATGADSVGTWGRQLIEAGARVAVFDLRNLKNDAGAPAKDLNDTVTERGFVEHRAELSQLFSK